MTATTTTQAPTYRRFTFNVAAGCTQITETTPTIQHPINWTGYATREGAWARAQARYLPALVTTLKGQATHYTADQVFSPKAFEEAMYSGYVGYGISMTDGYYAPIKQDAWVERFRKDVLASMSTEELREVEKNYNDAPREVKASIFQYARLLKAATDLINR